MNSRSDRFFSSNVADVAGVVAEEGLKVWTVEACEALRFAQGDMSYVPRQNRDWRSG